MGGVYLSGSTKQASQLCQIFVVRKIKLKYGQCAVCKHNPPCESLQAELAHGVIEWPAGVFAGHGAFIAGFKKSQINTENRSFLAGNIINLHKCSFLCRWLDRRKSPFSHLTRHCNF
jgi:hypothetical protein